MSIEIWAKMQLVRSNNQASLCIIYDSYRCTCAWKQHTYTRVCIKRTDGPAEVEPHIIYGILFPLEWIVVAAELDNVWIMDLRYSLERFLWSLWSLAEINNVSKYKKKDMSDRVLYMVNLRFIALNRRSIQISLSWNMLIFRSCSN